MDIQPDTEENGLKKQLEEYSFLDKSYLDRKLICYKCFLPLNVFPILYSENIGNICGRCSLKTTSDNFGTMARQQAYEDLIKNLTFPCANKKYGCIEVLKFDEVLLHEENCRFLKRCPFHYLHTIGRDCSWTGNPKSLVKHLKSSHRSTKFMYTPQFEWPRMDKHMIFFTTIGSELITTVVIRYIYYNKLRCVAMVDGTELDSQCFMYHLELTDEDNRDSIILRRNQLGLLSNFAENLRSTETLLKVDIDRISEMLQNSKKVFAKFKFVKKSEEEIMKITGVKDGYLLSQGSSITSITATNVKNSLPDVEMLDELECPVCNEFMLPPIYVCIIGHSICNDCKTRVHECPSCRNQILETRNYTLEKLTEKVKYPCINREIGCGFVTTSDKIRQHETHCKLSKIPCILKCGWSGQTPGIYNHFLDIHFKSLLEHNTAFFKDLEQDKDIGYYFLYVMGELFCLSFKNCGELTIKYNIQHIGYLESEQKYMYTIQFSPVRESFCPCISITNLCQTCNDNLAESLGPGSVSIPRDLLKDYLFQNHLCYIKINIAKVC